MDSLRLAIVVPCFNEQEILPDSAGKLAGVLADMVARGIVAPGSFILFVNDGSTDNTWNIISSLHRDNPVFKGLSLSKNAGHQNALLAGMYFAVREPLDADAVITIDADLQDSLECIPRMVEYCLHGAEIVYGVRSDRQSDSFFKRLTAESFYKFQQSIGIHTVFNHADFRLMTRRAVLELEKYTERNFYLRGIVPMLGLRSEIVEGERSKRIAGHTKYNFSKMMSLAFDGITSFSVRPMYMIMAIGGIFILVAIAIAIYVLVSLLSGTAVHGWSSLMLSIWLVGGMLMLSVGLVGLYVGKVFIETKHRPRYHIDSLLS